MKDDRQMLGDSQHDPRALQLDPVCGHRKELFQPVPRTVFY